MNRATTSLPVPDVAGDQHRRISRGDLRRVAQYPAPFDRLADDAQVGARRRMVETSGYGGVDTLGTIVVDVVVRLCHSQHRHCPPCLWRFWAFAAAATTSLRAHWSAHKALWRGLSRVCGDDSFG